MTDVESTTQQSHIMEMMVNNYFHRWDGGDDAEYLQEWAHLRKEFPTLCGDPPPKRWMRQVREWLLQVGAGDPEFSPVCFKFSTAVIDSNFRYQRGPQWDGTPEELAIRIMPLKFSSSDPRWVLDSYRDFMLGLVWEMLPALSVDDLKGDGLSDDSEASEE